MQERAVRTNVTQDRALRELEPLAFSSIADYLFDEEGRLTLAPGAPPNAMAAVAHFKSRVTTDGQGCRIVESELTLWDKPSMLKLAGRRLGLFSDRAQSIGGDNQEIERMSDPESKQRLEIERMSDSELKQRLLELAAGPTPGSTCSGNAAVM